MATGTLSASESGERESLTEDRTSTASPAGRSIIPIQFDPVELASESEPEIYTEALELCKRRLGHADRILIFVQDGPRLALKASYGSHAAFLIMKTEVSRAIIRRVRRTRRAIHIADALSDSELRDRQSISEIGQRSVLCAPIMKQGKTLGIIYADSVSLVNAFHELELRWSIRLCTTLAKKLSKISDNKVEPSPRPLTTHAATSAVETRQSKPIPILVIPGTDIPVATTKKAANLTPATILSGPLPSLSEKAVFLRALACMLSSGFPIHGALQILADSPSRMSSYTNQMLLDINRGYPLSKAFSRYPQLFGPDFRNLIEVGENSGNLDISVDTLANSLERDIELRGKVVGAITYPAVIAIFCLMGCLLAPPLFLNNLFSELAKSNIEMPLLSKIVMLVSAALWNPVTILLLTLAFWGISSILRSSKTNLVSRARLEALVIRIPAIGEICKNLMVLKFVNALALLLEAGLYLDKSLRLAAQASGSPQMEKEIEFTVQRLIAGETLAFAMSRVTVFPRSMEEFIRVGEETGRLGDMFRFVESLLRLETDHSIEVGQSLLEPLAMAGVGIMVGTVALACLLPLTSMIESLL